jgi:hypothetical protein
MARLAFDASNCGVAAMRKVNMVGHPVHLAPWDRHSLAYVIDDPRLLRRLTLRLIVTIRADINVRYGRPNAVNRIRVTVDAFSLYCLNVKLVIEIDGL